MNYVLKCSNLLPSTKQILNCVRFAGHSKWQNIRHTKASKDAERSRVIGRAIKNLRRSIYLGGGSTDPKVNPHLSGALEYCHKVQVPTATIDRAITNIKNAKLKTLLLEILGPGGSYIIADAETDHVPNFKYSVKLVCKKFKG